MESIISRARGASRETISEMRPQFFAWVEQLFRNRLMPSKLSAINKLMRTIFPGRKAFQKLVFYGEKEEEKKKRHRVQTRNFFGEKCEAREIDSFGEE